MSNSQNRARARARYDRVGGVVGPTAYDTYATRPEAAGIGWPLAALAGVTSRSGPQTDHLAILVRRARRREAIRRALRLWAPRRQPSLPGVPTEVSVRDAVQTGLSAALPRQAAAEHYAVAVARSRRMHPAGGKQAAGHANQARRQQAWHAAHPMAERRRGRADRRSLDEAHAGPERRGSQDHYPTGRRHIDLPHQRSRQGALAREA